MFFGSDRYDIVVAGGDGGSRLLQSSEIYNTGTGVWREGPPLPDAFDDMASVQYEDTFLVIGGFDGSSTRLDTIYQYDPNSESWVLRPERLASPRGAMGAVLTGPPLANCS